MLNAALRYLAFGWAVMPLKPRSKEPLLGTWTEYQTRLPTVTEVTRWFTENPDANLAVLTGAQSNLGVVDVDGVPGAASLACLSLTSPVVSFTGRGRQLFFRHPGGRLPNSVRSLPGIDVRGDGGYVVAPPSLHPNGKRYQWLNPVSGATVLPDFPVAIFAPIVPSSSPVVSKPAGWMADALKGLSNGNRNDTFASVVGRMHRDRWTPDDIRTVLLPHALRVEFSERELDTVIWSITRKPVFITSRGNVQSGMHDATRVQSKLVLRTFGGDMGEYEKRKLGNRHLEFPTGYARFDNITTGLQRGELLIVGARPEAGKTNWLLSGARNICCTNKRVLLLSTEMAFDRIWDRYLALGGVGEKHPFVVCDDFTPDIRRVRDALIGSSADVFIFDHINILGDDNETISTFLKGLKALAREFNIPGIVAAQLNRQAQWKNEEGNPIEPELHHLKGSGSLEEVGAQVLLLQVKEDADDAKFIQGFVRKNRYGEKGIVDFVLRKQPYRVEEL